MVTASNPNDFNLLEDLVEMPSEQEIQQQAVNEILGNWAWKDDGVNKNGDIILAPNGVIGHECGWSGGSWELLSDGILVLNFNGEQRTCALLEDRKSMV